MDRFIQQGHAHDDWTVIAKDALESNRARSVHAMR